MEIGNRLDALVEVCQFKFLVWRMQIVTVQAKPHKHDLDAKLLFKKRADGYTAAATDRDGRFMENGFDSSGCRLVGLAVDWRHIGLSAVMFFGFDRDAGRRDLFEI